MRGYRAARGPKPRVLESTVVHISVALHAGKEGLRVHAAEQSENARKLDPFGEGSAEAIRAVDPAQDDAGRLSQLTVAERAPARPADQPPLFSYQVSFDENQSLRHDVAIQ